MEDCMEILHISDLHIDVESGSEIAEKIIEAITSYSEENQSLSPEIMVITGDFTNKGSAIEFENAKKVIADIKSGIPSIKDCVIVPGNHDYIWENDGKDVSKDLRGVNYKNFKNNCEQDKLCNSYGKILNKDFKKRLDAFLISHAFVKESSFAVLIIGMNSDMIESIERKGQGYFDKKQHGICKDLINYYKKICEKEGKTLIIMAAFHHHVLPVSSVERDTLEDPSKFSLTLDARRTLNFFMENGVKLAIHGHQHQPSIVCWKDEMRENGEKIYVISTGSMSSDRSVLGDISKNSFMLYDINEKEVSVLCFQNSDNDQDLMRLNHIPYHLELVNPYSDVQCNVNENSVPPREIEIEKYSCKDDTSDLFYLFLNVVDCTQSREEILKLKDIPKIKICGIHHLFGRYDILLKYRASETDGDKYQKKVIQYLKSHKYMLKDAGHYFINISYENKEYKPIEAIPLLKNPDAYLKSTWNMATLTVRPLVNFNVEDFFLKLKNLIKIFNAEHNTKLDDIIRSYAIGQDQSITFELFISCYQFPMLTRFTNIIENIIRDDRIDKYTHIIYYFDERGI